MTLHPPLSLEDAGTVEEAVDWRHWIYAVSQLFGGQGVINSTSLQVTQLTAGGSPSVQVAPGPAVVAGSAAHQGSYFVYSDANATVTLNTPDGTHPRIDVIYAHVRDNAVDSGGNNDWVLTKVTGSAAGTPLVPTITDSNVLVLAHVTVPPGTPSSLSIADLRPVLPVNMTLTGSLGVGGNLVVSGTGQIGASQIDGLVINGVKIMHAGLTLSDQWGWQQDAGGNVFYNVAAGGTHHWRNASLGGTSELMTLQQLSGSALFAFPTGLPNYLNDGHELAVVYHTGTGVIRVDSSSRRYKTNEAGIHDYADAVEVVKRVVPKTFQMRDPETGDATGPLRAGFIAEDVAAAFPPGAAYAEHDGEVLPEGLNNTALVGVLWGAVQVLAAKVERLEADAASDGR